LKLIREEVLDVTTSLVEENGVKKLYLEGIFLQGGRVNRNGRFYPPETLNREANRYIKESVEQNRAYGELGHPDKPKLNLERISHRIVSLKPNGNDWLGKAIVIPEGMGKIARGIIETGGILGMSSRGLGSLKEDKKNGYNVVQDDYHLVVGADIVTDPSAPDAFVKGIMEGVEWFCEGDDQWRCERIEDLRKDMHKMTVKDVNEEADALFDRFIRIIGI
jgi:hypothetical protein